MVSWRGALQFLLSSSVLLSPTLSLSIMARSTVSLLQPILDYRQLNALPQLIVFDLDQCLWHPEMYTLDEMPTKKVIGPLGNHGDGVIGVYSGREQIHLFPDALRVLQEIYLDCYPGVRIAAASSADTSTAVRIGKAAMEMLEILPGVTMRQAFAKGWSDGFDGNMQIGRSPPLSSDKSATHFPILKQQTGIEYNQMVFFDDCNWGDHCGNVSRRCPGVIAQRTPDGLQISEFAAALKAFSHRSNRA
jgi:magnesium-dependent phosphatase 1